MGAIYLARDGDSSPKKEVASYRAGDQQQGVASCLACAGDSSPEQVQAMFEEQDADLSRGRRLHYDLAAGEVGNAGEEEKGPGQEDSKAQAEAFADTVKFGDGEVQQQKVASYLARDGAWGYRHGPWCGGCGYGHWSVGGCRESKWLQEDSKAQAEAFASANKCGDGEVQQQEVANYRAGNRMQEDSKAQAETIASANKYSNGEGWQQEKANYPARDEDNSPKQVQDMFEERNAKVRVAILLMQEAGIHIAVNDEMAQSFLDYAQDQPGEVLEEVQQCGGDLHVAKGIIQALVGRSSAKTETQKNTDRTTGADQDRARLQMPVGGPRGRQGDCKSRHP